MLIRLLVRQQQQQQHQYIFIEKICLERVFDHQLIHSKRKNASPIFEGSFEVLFHKDT